MSELNVKSVVEHVFTTSNPDTGSVPSDKLAWIIFENGTVYLTKPNDDFPVDIPSKTFVEKALDECLEFGPAVVGTSSADFSVSRLPWYPDQFVYMVRFNHSCIFNIIIMDEETDHMVVGLRSRIKRNADIEEQNIKYLRDFEGNNYALVKRSE